jgi:phage major head subunit gpT-like protein
MAQNPIRSSKLDALNTNFNFRFNSGVAQQRTSAFWQKLADEVMSNTSLNEYPFLGDLGPMKEWIGPRVVNQLAAWTFRLKNRDFEKTFAVPRNAILDDQVGLYGRQAQLLGYQAEKLPDDLLVTAIQNGTASSAITYDGQPFFSANHPVNANDPASAVQSNNLTSTALNAANYDTARQAMRLFKGDGGRIMGLTPDTLIVPPQLEKTAKDIVNSNLIAVTQGSGAAAINNNLQGTADVLVIPELGTDALTWYLAVTKLPVKPLIWQNRQAPVFASQTDPQSKAVFYDKEFVYGADARGAAGYGLWWMMLRATA